MSRIPPLLPPPHIPFSFHHHLALSFQPSFTRTIPTYRYKCVVRKFGENHICMVNSSQLIVNLRYKHTYRHIMTKYCCFGA